MQHDRDIIETSVSSPHDDCVLICEDDIFISMELVEAIEQEGFRVLGPFPEVSVAIDAIAEATPKMAILDINLADGDVFPLAKILRERQVAIVFHSAAAENYNLERHYPEAKVIPKPARRSLLQRVARAAMFDTAVQPLRDQS